MRGLAERSNISPSFLSQIENGQCSPSISSMEKIVNALGVTMGQFFLSASQHPVSITRAYDRAPVPLDWSKGEISSIGALQRNGSQFQVSMVTLKPGGLTGKHPTPTISDELAVVFTGSAILRLQDEEQALECGDSATISAGTSRQWRNETESVVQILVVSTHPY